MGSENAVAVYLRLSLDDDNARESDSIVNQRALLTSYIQNHEDLKGYKMIEFCDDGFSGLSFDRPGVKRLLDQVRSGQISCIIVKDVSRFGRSYIDVGDYLEQIFPFLGVRFISVLDNYDSADQANSAGDVGMAIKHILHNYYSRDLSLKIKAARKVQMERGDFISPFAIFGYEKSKTDKHKLEIDPEAAEIVRYIFTQVIQGKTTTEIAKTLNNTCTPPRSAYKHQNGCSRNWFFITDNIIWTSDLVLSIVMDLRYTGCMVNGKNTRVAVGSSKTKSIPKNMWYVKEDTHEAIITREEFQKARESIKSCKSKTFLENKPVDVLLGKIQCGGCGRTLHKTGTKNMRYYCRSSRFQDNSDCFRNYMSRADTMDALLASMKTLLATLLDEERVRQRIQSERRQTGKDSIAQLRLLSRQLEILKSRKITLYEQYVDGVIAKEEYIKEKQAVDTQLSHITDQIHKTEIHQKLETSIDVNPVLKLLETLDLQKEPTKDMMDALVDKIYLYGEERMEIIWKFVDEFE